MIKKRIIGAILIKNSTAVQSYGYNEYRPLGNPIYLAENLSRWKVDEILVNCIDATRNDQKPDLDLIRKISRVCAGTPITYGGGVREKNDALEVIQAGADRLMINSLYMRNYDAINSISTIIGRQALVLSFPFFTIDNDFYYYDYLAKLNKKINDVCNNEFINSNFSDIILDDVVADGGRSTFNIKILNNLKLIKIRIICMGGINSIKNIKRLLNHKYCDGIAIGNYLNYGECRIKYISSQLTNTNVRKVNYG